MRVAPSPAEVLVEVWSLPSGTCRVVDGSVVLKMHDGVAMDVAVSRSGVATLRVECE